MSVTSYLQMMRPLQLTLRRTFSGFWTAFQMLVDTFIFGLTISLAKTQVMGQDIKEIPLLFIHNYKLEVIHEFVYLGSIPSQTTCPSTVNSISELGRLP